MRKTAIVWVFRTLVATAFLACALAGCGVGGDNSPPVIANAQASPDTLEAAGGDVTISAQVTDSAAVADVWAVIQDSSGSGAETVTLTPGASNVYSALWTAGGNPSQDGTTLQYTIRIHARDANGNESASAALTVTVQAATPPPGGPPF